MSKPRGKRPGLRARSKNARKVLAVIQAFPRIDMSEREELYTLREWKKLAMRFHAVEEGAPHEGNLVLVRLKDSTYRFGMVLNGRFANYEYHAEEFVTMAHPERITHWMQVLPPVPFTAQAEGETPKAEGSMPTIEQAAIAAAGIDRAEDVYA